jgi:hypothetical protein
VRVAIVYESLLGNTREIALAVTDGVRRADPQGKVSCAGVRETSAAQLGEVDLLFVGGPTHFLGMASARTRRMWLRDQDVAAARTRSGHPLDPGAASGALREWLDLLAQAPAGGCAAAFDTRLERFTAGGAAPRIARRLRRRGYEIAARPIGFIVDGMEGPLRAGETERAALWAAETVRRTALERERRSGPTHDG